MPDVLILAAGLGTRMKSKRAKVLHELAGRPLISYVVRAALGLKPERLITVVGHQAEEVQKAVTDAAARNDGQSADTELVFALQQEQRGTGHAVMAARQTIEKMSGPLVVVAGDGPLLKTSTLQNLIAVHQSEGNDATLLTVRMSDPTGYGRILRDERGNFIGMVEQKDANPDQQKIDEVCVSIYCFNPAPLTAALDHLTTDNAQGEYYLTDVPAIMQKMDKRVGTLLHDDSNEVLGINTRVELAELAKSIRHRVLRDLMLSGVSIIDPDSTYIDEGVQIGGDTVIYPQVIIQGKSKIGSGCNIESWSRLRNVDIGDDVTIKNSSIVEDSEIAARASVGPFARLRMNAVIGEQAVIGNFVEVKKSQIGANTKAQHLSYLGDATLGSNVNIGAGTITCNYDGVRKHQTLIEDNVKIGSDTMLVAPVKVGKGSVTGAGSVVTKEVPPDSLAVGVPAKVVKDLKK